MLPQILPAESFEAFAAYLARDRRLVAPVAKGPQYAFAEVGPDELDRIRMDYDVSILPPKKYLLPQEETLLSFENRSPQGVVAPVKARPCTTVLKSFCSLATAIRAPATGCPSAFFTATTICRCAKNLG